mgnify:FL=1
MPFVDGVPFRRVESKYSVEQVGIAVKFNSDEIATEHLVSKNTC